MAIDRLLDPDSQDTIRLVVSVDLPTPLLKVIGSTPLSDVLQCTDPNPVVLRDSDNANILIVCRVLVSQFDVTLGPVDIDNVISGE